MITSFSRGLRTRCAVVIVLLSFSKIASAQTPAPLEDKAAATDKQRATALFKRAEVSYRLLQFEKALTDYKAALKLHHHPNILFNIAQCYRQLKKPDKALFFYKLFLADWARLKPGTKPSNHVEVRNHIVRLEAEIKRREARRLQREREAQRLKAEELALERAKLVAQGRRALAEAARREAARRVAERKAQKARPALLRIAGLDTVLARVLVDGEHRATTPIASAIPVKPGIVEVDVRAKGYQPWRKQLQVLAGKETVLRVNLAPKKRSTFWLVGAIASTVLAAGAEAAAVVFTLQARDHYEGTPSFERDRDHAIGGHVAAGVLGAFALTSFVLYVRSGETAERLSARVLPFADGAVASARICF